MDNYTSLFILGNPRSGTSLLRIMLDNHNNITIPPEAGFIQWWSEKYGDWNQEDSRNKKKIVTFLSDLSTSRKIETWRLNYSSLENLLEKLQPKNYCELSQAVILQYARQNDKNPLILGDKNNYYLEHLPVLQKYFPRAKFLAIIRDGRDVACSYLEMKNVETDSPYKPLLPSSIDLIAEEWNINNNKISKFFDTLKEHQHMWIKYEDLIFKTEHTLKEVCEFLKVNFDEQMLEYYKVENEPVETLAWKKKTRKKPDASNIGIYKQKLTPQEINLFNSLNLVLLQNFGYEAL